MLERNRFLVKHASTLLAVYNGEQRGGTAATMRYAQKMGREIIVIDPITRSITHQGNAPPAARPGRRGTRRIFPARMCGK